MGIEGELVAYEIITSVAALLYLDVWWALGVEKRKP
jgi:hypothetical protein